MNILSGTFHTVKNAVNPPKYHYFASLKLKIFPHKISPEIFNGSFPFSNENFRTNSM